MIMAKCCGEDEGKKWPSPNKFQQRRKATSTKTTSTSSCGKSIALFLVTWFSSGCVCVRERVHRWCHDPSTIEMLQRDYGNATVRRSEPRSRPIGHYSAGKKCPHFACFVRKSPSTTRYCDWCNCWASSVGVVVRQQRSQSAIIK